tara:strand:+ start:237 stop:3920 length:3684 start_codon:yes stop_codon:yes gene_type:complete
MIELSPKFKSALGSSRTTSVYPVLRIYKGVRLDEENQDFEGQSDSVLNLSIKSTTLKNFAGVYENYEPLLINTPSLTTTADLINNKFTTSSMSVNISNYEYSGKKFSDNVVDYLKSVCQVFFVCNGIDSLEDSLLMYTGTIRRFNQSAESITLNLEDYTQQILSIQVPSTLIPEDSVQYDENLFGKPYPAVYGNLDATPLIYNKLDRLEIDKPNQQLFGTWNEGTQVDFENEDVTQSHKLYTKSFLRNNAFVSVYDESFLHIFQKGVQSWGSRPYNSGDLDYTNLEFYTFDNAVDGISANFKLNSNALVYSQYTEINGELEGTGSIGIPARVYRPIDKVTFFAINQENQIQLQTGEEDVFSPLYLSCNKFVGYQNNGNIADEDIREYMEGYTESDANNEVTPNVTDSFMQTEYENDWNPESNPSPTMYWWQPTAINDTESVIPDKEIYATKDINWQNYNEPQEFNPQWVQNGNNESGLHYKGVNFRDSGAYARFQLKSVGSYPCVTKVFYNVSTIRPLTINDSLADKTNDMMCTHFWCEKELVKRYSHGSDGFEEMTEDDNKFYWQKNRGSLSEIPEDDWYTPAMVPSGTHEGYFKDVVTIFDDGDSNNGNSKRIDSNINAQFDTSSQFAYINIIKGWNETNTFDSIQWGSPLNKRGSNNQWCLANLKELYILQDILVNDLNNRDFYGNVAGRIDDDGNQISRIEDISKDILANEANFEQNIENNSTFDGWKYDFVLNEQKELKQVFEGLYKSSIAIPSYDNFGQFKLIPIHQTLDNIEYQIIEAKDVFSYNFTLTKLDDVKNQVRILYKKNYASGEFEGDTSYAIKDLETEQTYQTYDALTQAIYPEDTYPNDELRYNVEYYGLTEGEAKLDVESEYIRDDITARKLQQRLVSFYANQHLIVKCDLPLNYINLESGDYIKFDSLLNEQKVFGYDYTKSSIKNGQFVYPQFFITKITKSIEKVSIEAVQVHRGEYGIPNDEMFNDDDGIVFDNGNNDGDINLDLGDPFDNPSYGDETIDQDEPEIDLFNVSISQNTIVNNGPVYVNVDENLISDWMYVISLKKVSTPDGSGVIFEDINLTLEDGDYDETNQPQFDFFIEDLFHVSKTQSNLADEFSGQLSITKKYAIDPLNAELEFEIKIFPLISENADEYTEFVSFKQIGENVFYPVGDVNGDYVTNVLDVVRLAKIVNGTATNVEDGELERGDMNDDGITNVLDVVILVNLILGQ